MILEPMFLMWIPFMNPPLVVQTTLAAMIQCFEWKADGVCTRRVDMEEGIGITLPRANPLICSPIIRLNSIPSGKVGCGGQLLFPLLIYSFFFFFFF
ncbi:hypothetical protein ACP275_09G035600 [Erythranthe tilingii]